MHANAEVDLKECSKLLDELFKLRQKRYKVQREAEELKKLELERERVLIHALTESKAGGIVGRVARCEVKLRVIPKVEDWDAVHDFVKRKKRWDLLTRRLNTKAVAELWDDGAEVPGVVPDKVLWLSVGKK